MINHVFIPEELGISVFWYCYTLGARGFFSQLLLYEKNSSGTQGVILLWKPRKPMICWPLGSNVAWRQLSYFFPWSGQETIVEGNNSTKSRSGTVEKSCRASNFSLKEWIFLAEHLPLQAKLFVAAGIELIGVISASFSFVLKELVVCGSTSSLFSDKGV